MELNTAWLHKQRFAKKKEATSASPASFPIVDNKILQRIQNTGQIIQEDDRDFLSHHVSDDPSVDDHIDAVNSVYLLQKKSMKSQVNKSMQENLSGLEYTLNNG